MTDTAEYVEAFLKMLYEPAPDLKLYSLNKAGRRIPHSYDSGFMEVMALAAR